MSSALSKVEQVALYLGQPWKFNRLRQPSNYWFEIIDGSGRGLHFRADRRKFSISGIFPPGMMSGYRNDYKTIGVSITRPAKDIATDIIRRFLPHYLHAYDNALIRYAQEKETQQRLSYIAQSLATVTGGRIAEHGRGARTVYFEHAIAEISRDERVTLDLRNLSIEQAIRIAAILQSEE